MLQREAHVSSVRSELHSTTTSAAARPVPIYIANAAWQSCHSLPISHIFIPQHIIIKDRPKPSTLKI